MAKESQPAPIEVQGTPLFPFPPLEEGKAASNIDLYREPESSTLLILLPSGDSFEVNPEIARLYLTRIGSERAEDIVDYLWNFYSVRYFPSIDHFIWVAREEIFDEQAAAAM